MKTCKAQSCDNRFKPMSPLQVVCSPRCAVDYTKAKATKKQAKQWRQEKQQFQANDLPRQLKLTQRIFNRMRVKEELLWFKERGLEPTCISCGKPNMDWCCGHLKTVGAQSNLRFDRKNTHLQCNRNCNMGLSGNIHGTKNFIGYLEGLKARFGEELGQAIIDYCNTNTDPVKWTGQQLIEMRREFARRDRELEQKLQAGDL